MNLQLLFLGLFVIVDILGFSLILPLFPFLSKNFNLSATHIGLLQSSNAVAQLIATPFIGSLSDCYGRKPLLLICVFGTLVSFIILGLANSVFWLFFSRILDGIIGGNISLAKSYISDITTKDERSVAMGIIGASFGIGFIIGPAIGGILVKYNFRYPIYLAAILSAINFVGVFFYGGIVESSITKKKNYL